ncbi:MAG: hypothetical protein V3U52_05955, partial [Thermoplasmata archaeon]
GSLLWASSVDAFSVLGVDMQGDSLSDVLAFGEETGPMALNGSTGSMLWDMPFYRLTRSVAPFRDGADQVSLVLVGEDWVSVLVSGPIQTYLWVVLVISVPVAVSLSIAAFAYRRWRRSRDGPGSLD